MSDTLTNSGPLQIGASPVEEYTGNGAATDQGETTVSSAEGIPVEEYAGDSDSTPTVPDEPQGASFDETPPTSNDATSTSGDTLSPEENIAFTPLNDASTEPVTAVTPASPVIPAPPIAPLIRPLQTKRILLIALPLLVLTLVGTIIPAIMAASYAMNAYMTYTTLRSQAYDGVQHLLNVKTVFTGLSTHPSGFLDVNKLHLAQKEFLSAHKDFQQVQFTLDHAPVIATVTTYLPQYRSQITAARATSQIGIDVANIGQELINAATVLAPTFRSSLLNDANASASSHQPLVTPAMLELMRTTITHILPFLSDIQAQSHLFSFTALPLNSHQQEQLLQLIQAIPQAAADLTQVRDLLDAAGWMLGVNEPRSFLVQTMDRAELRPTGGFTGQFGELSINGGRVAPFALKDISLVEYVANSPTLGVMALPQYRSWWPFVNWGLRDSNLSADFPTSAQIAITKYKSEIGHQVDGVIMFTPFLIEHILQVVGPIKVPGYNDTITAQNLEERLHYYQQDNSGLAKQVVYQPGDTATSSRKRFTSLLAHLLIDQVRHAPPDEIIAIARQMLHDLKTKDLQVYVTNPQVEALLVQYGDAAQIDRSTTHDGVYVVQANVSASKASQYVRTIIHDTVSLNSSGGATHLMQIRLVYNQLGPVYGYDTYHDYLRVYVPPTSKYLWGDGFDSGTPLCGAYLAACPQTDVYPKDELLCPPGQYQPGAAAPSIADEDGGRWHPLDTVGPPTNLVSDEPGRAMFGGWVVVPKNCTMTVTLSWYVPPLFPGQGQAIAPTTYALLVQRQAGTFPELALTILPTPGNCGALRSAGLYFDDILGEDTTFSLRSMPPSNNARNGCYPQPGI